MNALHGKIYGAKMLLLKKDEINHKNFKFGEIRNEFCIPQNILIEFSKNGLVKLNNCSLSKDYIADYRALRKDFENKEHRIAAGSMVSGGGYHDPKKTSRWKTYLNDRYCDLSPTVYENLAKDGKVKFDIENFPRSTIILNNQYFLPFRRFESHIWKT